MDTNYSVAIHEAGHTVVGLLCDRDLYYVSIVPDEEDGTLGRVHSKLPTPPDAVEKYTDSGHYESPTTMSTDGKTITLADGREFPFTMGESEWTVEQEALEAVVLQSIRDWATKAYVLPTLAGAMAEQRVTGVWNAEGAVSDMLSVGESIEEFFGRDDKRLVAQFDDEDTRNYGPVVERARERWGDDVNELLDRGWAWIEAVAQALMRPRTAGISWGTLTGDEAKLLQPPNLT